MHGLPEFNIMAAARTVETVQYIPVGFHVCVCDPGVGTDRKGIICLVARGDYLIAPENGVLLPETFPRSRARCCKEPWESAGAAFERAACLSTNPGTDSSLIKSGTC